MAEKITFDLDLNDPAVWDDSALVNSWNDALSEYKKYHSIHAQGKKLEDVLTDEELIRLKMKRPERSHDKQPLEEILQDDVEMEPHADDESKSYDHTNGKSKPRESKPHKQPSAPSATTLGSAMAQTLTANVQDENLKNLMMGWYYAGYYTGLYEGQQKGTQDQSSNTNV